MRVELERAEGAEMVARGPKTRQHGGIWRGPRLACGIAGQEQPETGQLDRLASASGEGMGVNIACGSLTKQLRSPPGCSLEASKQAGKQLDHEEPAPIGAGDYEA